MIRKPKNKRQIGIQAALASALFLGLSPVFGKQAILWGFDSKAIVAFRAGIAVILLLLLMLIFKRKFFFIYPVGLVGCFLAGAINGIGSLCYYGALERLDASTGQLIYSIYPLFVAVWLMLDKQPMRPLTYLRLFLSLPAIYLVMRTGHGPVDMVGVGLMLTAACLYALHLIINQWVLYEVPAPTVTLYTLLAMSAVVIPVFLVSDRRIPVTAGGIDFLKTWWPVLGMALIIFLSRITLFVGVKHLGGIQTALLGLAELIVAVFLSQAWLGERLSPTQWLGAAFLAINLILVGIDRALPEVKRGSGWFAWLHPSKFDW
jgi:drug/metabolite transporter (DMT)-like permease